MDTSLYPSSPTRIHRTWDDDAIPFHLGGKLEDDITTLPRELRGQSHVLQRNEQWNDEARESFFSVFGETTVFAYGGCGNGEEFRGTTYRLRECGERYESPQPRWTQVKVDERG